MIKIEIYNSKLIAIYSPENGVEWLQERIEKGKDYNLKNTYKLNKHNLIRLPEDDDFKIFESIAFQIGIVKNNFIKLDKMTFNINKDIYFDKSINILPSFFTANKNISIVSKLSNVIDEELYIIKDEDYDIDKQNNSLPISAYKTLIKTFPNDYELYKYSDMRIATQLENYFDNLDVIKKSYEDYLNKKIKSIQNTKFSQKANTLKLSLLISARDELKQMLENYSGYDECSWQYAIKDILCVLFPKYNYAVREVSIENINGFKKRPDFTMIDCNGYVDIMEIKKPDEKQIIRETPNRNNFVPQKRFTDIVVQTTKYINALNQNQDKAKENIFKKLKNDNPNTTLTKNDIKINNPKGIILLSRSDKLSIEQKDDLELLRRQFKDVSEIMTYDDLLERFDNLIKKLEMNK